MFVGVGDPIGTGLVASLARPGGNVTGLATIEWEAFTAKTLQVIKETLPRASRIAILMNPTNRMNAWTLPQEQAAASTLGVKLQLVEARDVSELERAFVFLVKQDGRIGKVDVVRSTGTAVLDQYMANAIRLAAPFPPLPSRKRRSQSH